MWPACGRPAAFGFYFSNGLVRVCEIELTHMGKNNGNPDQLIQLPKMFASMIKMYMGCIDNTYCRIILK